MFGPMMLFWFTPRRVGRHQRGPPPDVLQERSTPLMHWLSSRRTRGLGASWLWGAVVLAIYRGAKPCANMVISVVSRSRWL